MDHLTDIAPSRYVRRVSRLTGEEISGPIDPDELLIHAHRDQHPVQVAAQFLASRAVQLTGSESLAGQGLRAINTFGSHLARTVGTVISSAEVERSLMVGFATDHHDTRLTRVPSFKRLNIRVGAAHK